MCCYKYNDIRVIRILKIANNSKQVLIIKPLAQVLSQFEQFGRLLPQEARRKAGLLQAPLRCGSLPRKYSAVKELNLTHPWRNAHQ